MKKNSLCGRCGIGSLDTQKLEYIKTLVRSRVPEMSPIDFEPIWSLCRTTLSKSCQDLRQGFERFNCTFAQENNTVPLFFFGCCVSSQ